MTKYSITYDVNNLLFTPYIQREGEMILTFNHLAQNSAAFSFMKNINWGCLPPVTKYTSPILGKMNFIIVQRKPSIQKLFNADHEIPFPWHSFVFIANEQGLITKSGLFFNKEQIYSSADLFYPSWYFNVAWDNSKEYDFNNLESITEFIDSYFIDISSLKVSSKEIGFNIEQLCFPESFENNFKSIKIDILNDIFNFQISNHNDFFENFKSMNLKEVVEFDFKYPLFNINQIHAYALDLSLKSIPTLSEVLKNLTTASEKEI